MEDEADYSKPNSGQVTMDMIVEKMAINNKGALTITLSMVDLHDGMEWQVSDLAAMKKQGPVRIKIMSLQRSLDI